MSVLDEIRNDAAGAALLADWLGEGGEPVDRKLAEWRAFTCTAGQLGQPCTFNIAPNWWDKIKSAIADTIKSELALQNRIAVQTTRDGSLHMCQVCGCCLRLKVHVPVKHVEVHTPAGSLDKFPQWCWIRRELELLKKQQS